MERILRLAILIVLIMAGIKYGKPFLEQTLRGNSSPEVSEERPGGECVNAAGEARDVFGDRMRVLRPGSEVSDLAYELDDAIARARSQCYCSGTACERANAALDVLSDMASRVADPSQIGSAAMRAARDLERVNDLIDQAAAAAR